MTWDGIVKSVQAQMISDFETHSGRVELGNTAHLLLASYCNSSCISNVERYESYYTPCKPIRWLVWIVSFTSVTKELFLEVEGWPKLSMLHSLYICWSSFALETFMPSFYCKLHCRKLHTTFCGFLQLFFSICHKISYKFFVQRKKELVGNYTIS
jgi:hypothetical protein